MKKFHLLIIAVVGLLVAMAVASYDSRAEERRDLVNSVSHDDGLMLSTVHTHFTPLLDADMLSPKLVSNFNGLVRFPEIGSASLCDGYGLPTRAPPKSQLMRTTMLSRGPNLSRLARRG